MHNLLCLACYDRVKGDYTIKLEHKVEVVRRIDKFLLIFKDVYIQPYTLNLKSLNFRLSNLLEHYLRDYVQVS